MLQAPCYQLSIDSGTQRTLLDVAGQPLYAWDTEDRAFKMGYDALRRNTGKWLSGTVQLEKTVYGESYLPDPKVLNLRGQVYGHYDGSGKQSVPLGYDFKGNPVQNHLQLVLSKTLTDPDWDAAPPVLAAEVFISSATIDALNRPVTQTDPGAHVTTYIYDKGGALKKVLLDNNEYVKDIRYDAKGQRRAIWYGNGTKTGYTYDVQTFRLRRLLTIKLSTNEPLQDLDYYYDPVGNITEIKDDAQQDVFFNNTVVSPTQQYTYDALYRLREARGREQKNNAAFDSTDNTGDSEMLSNNPLKWDSGALQLYIQQYSYDGAGNILQLKHIAGTGSYTRDYNYSGSSNKLVTTEAGSWLYTYGYDARGNMAAMPHLSVMDWNVGNELQRVTKGADNTYYQYSGGQRIRKYTDKGSIKEERIYLGSYEIYRKFDGSSLTVPIVERTTVHIGDDTGRIAMLEKRIKGTDASLPELQRYSYSNHLQSVSLELDETAAIISYEEYHPYGTTAYQATNATINAVAKRYRFTGKERDEESGLYYHGARYYIPWLARWTAVDPLESKYAGWSSYHYVKCNPVKDTDSTGMGGDDDLGGSVPKGVKGGVASWYSAESNNSNKSTTNSSTPKIPPINVFGKVDNARDDRSNGRPIPSRYTIMKDGTLFDLTNQFEPVKNKSEADVSGYNLWHDIKQISSHSWKLGMPDLAGAADAIVNPFWKMSQQFASDFNSAPLVRNLDGSQAWNNVRNSSLDMDAKIFNTLEVSSTFLLPAVSKVATAKKIVDGNSIIKETNGEFNASSFADEIIAINKTTEGGGRLLSTTPSSVINSAMYYETAAG